MDRKRYLNEMGIKEASRTVRRRLEMHAIRNNMGKEKKYEYRERVTSEHLIECRRRKVKEEEKIKVEWLRETDNIKKVSMVNEFMEKKIEERKLEGEKK